MNSSNLQTALDAFEKRIARLRSTSSTNRWDKTSRGYSGSRVGTSDMWRSQTSLQIMISGRDEDALLVKQNRIRYATSYYGLGKVLVSQYRSTFTGLINMSSVEGRDRILGLNMSASTWGLLDEGQLRYLPTAIMGDKIEPHVNGTPASLNDVVGLFRQYTEAFERIGNGSSVSEALGGLVLPECKLASWEQLVDVGPKTQVLTLPA